MPTATAEKRRINQHIINLNSPDEKVSSRAEGCLIRYYGNRAVQPLLEACDHSNPVVRLRAVWVLGFTHDPRAYESILRLTDDPDAGVRYDATIALGILGDERAIEPLKRICLCNDVSRPAGTAFYRMGVKTIPALTELLSQGSSEVRWSVTQVLGNFADEFGDERCVELLHVAANDPDPAVQENAEYWLEEIRKSEPHEGFMYYILALDEREYGPLDLPTLKLWMLEQRVTPATMLVDAKTRITTTLGAVLQDADQEFLATASAMAFRASHQTCMACGQILPNDATVCDKCGIMVSPPRGDADGFGSALKILGMVLGGIMIPIILVLLIVIVVWL